MTSVDILLAVTYLLKLWILCSLYVLLN